MSAENAVRSAAQPVATSAEVRQAIAADTPVVALESTIFTHGLPRPRNLEVARDAERLLRDHGVVPATIGVAAGTPTVGLSAAQIERLCTSDDVTKASVRDLPAVLAAGRDAGTTVAATSFLAYRAGIAVFATGGLGGVHRGAGTTFDESADLTTLSSTPIVVVSAGVKSILDIPATLERLETLSIPVIGYRTTRYPGFYCTDSGYEVDTAAQNPQEVAAMAAARDALGLPAALLVANPVPADKQLDPAEHDRILAEAWQAAGQARVTGKDTTPFLLDYIRRATGGRSVDVNVHAYRNNITVAAAIARAITASRSGERRAGRAG